MISIRGLKRHDYSSPLLARLAELEMKSAAEVLINFLSKATSRNISEWPFNIVLLILSVVIHLFASIDLGFEEAPTRVFLAAMAMAPMILFIKISMIFKSTNRIFSIIATILAIAIGGLFRGYIIQSGLVFLDVESRTSVAFRIPAGIVLSLFVTLIVGYAWTTLKEIRHLLSGLREENEKLAVALQQLQVETRQEETNRVFDLLSYIRDQIQLLSTISTPTQINQLEQLLKVIVRPISQNWAREVERFEPTLSSRPEVWNALETTKHLPNPFTVVSIVVCVSLIPMFATYGRDIAIPLVLYASVILYCSLLVGYFTIKKLSRVGNTLQRDFVISSVPSVIALPSSFLTVYVLRDTPYPFASFSISLVAIPLITWTLTIGNAARNESYTIIEKLEEIRGTLNWSIARINLLSWYHQGIISRLMHGTVQNSIHVGLFMIQTESNESKHKNIITDVIENIDLAIQQLSKQERNTSLDFAALMDLPEAWKGIASIDISIDEKSRAILSGDAAALAIVVDIVQEMCSNAIRHGAAKIIDVKLVLGNQTLGIDISDDGLPFKNETKNLGIGTQFIESCTLEHWRERVNSENRSFCAVPLVVR
jgi:two-component sensor histidine kinase